MLSRKWADMTEARVGGMGAAAAGVVSEGISEELTLSRDLKAEKELATWRSASRGSQAEGTASAGGNHSVYGQFSPFPAPSLLFSLSLSFLLGSRFQTSP